MFNRWKTTLVMATSAPMVTRDNNIIFRIRFWLDKGLLLIRILFIRSRRSLDEYIPKSFKVRSSSLPAGTLRQYEIT